mgnify:CR=1 FL=1
MLLKAVVLPQDVEPDTGFSTLYRVDAIEGPELTAIGRAGILRFSTLYRVDAIEGTVTTTAVAPLGMFQYPLSGRCY